MKFSKVVSYLFLIFLIFAIGQSQWLETTIYVPDSLNRVANPQVFAYNATNNKIYVGGVYGDGVIVIDGQTNQKIARIPTGTHINSLCWNSTNNKIYCASGGSDNLIVIDGLTNQVITAITVGVDPIDLVYNSIENKLYCSNGANVMVIDGATNSVITTVNVGDCPWFLVYNSTNNKVYCTKEINSVVVIDGTTDSVITTVQAGDEPCAFFWNSTNNKVYCANRYSNNIMIIDGATNSIITTIPVGYQPRALAWNSIQNRAYVANYVSSSISVIRDVTGIEESTTLDAVRLTSEIYPNPAKSVMRVRGPFSEKTIKIFDISGKVIKEIEILRYAQNDGVGDIKISLKGINPGIYFLKVGKETKKFLVVK